MMPLVSHIDTGLFSPGREIQAYFRGVADLLRADVAGRRALSERGVHMRDGRSA